MDPDELPADPSATGNFFAEFGQFLKHNKRWWLIPIAVASVVIVAAAALLPSQVAPFIYSLF